MVTCGSKEPPPQLTCSAARGTSPAHIAAPLSKGRALRHGDWRGVHQATQGGFAEEKRLPLVPNDLREFLQLLAVQAVDEGDQSCESSREHDAPPLVQRDTAGAGDMGGEGEVGGAAHMSFLSKQQERWRGSCARARSCGGAGGRLGEVARGVISLPAGPWGVRVPDSERSGCPRSTQRPHESRTGASGEPAGRVPAVAR
jgi:hypothetical protein